VSGLEHWAKICFRRDEKEAHEMNRRNPWSEELSYNPAASSSGRRSTSAKQEGLVPREPLTTPPHAQSTNGPRGTPPQGSVLPRTIAKPIGAASPAAVSAIRIIHARLKPMAVPVLETPGVQSPIIVKKLQSVLTNAAIQRLSIGDRILLIVERAANCLSSSKEGTFDELVAGWRRG
jgi:hypothetical protein